jgi:putative tricarboxylic transport membrane protein
MQLDVVRPVKEKKRMWIEGFAHALSGMNILWLLLGSGIGLVVGVLPAIGANFGVALMLPFTFGMDPASAIIMLCAIHAACNYGDSITSILLNVPGGPGTVASCWDGYPLTQQGRGGEALGIATFSSFIGGVSVWLLLALLVGPITRLAFAFGSPEYFALMVSALGLVSLAAKGETLKGLIMVCIGLALSAIGQDEVLGTTYRFAMGIPWLEAGIPIVVSTLGIFAIPQVIEMLEAGGSVAKRADIKDSILKGFGAPLRRPLTLLRAGSIGAFVGILPAIGVTLAGIAAYLTEKKYSKEASEFGKGAPGGLVAAEVGKGACVVGDLIPTFTLGVPGSVTGAILLAALIMQGIEPGPRFLLSGVLPYTVFASILLAQVTFLVSGIVIGKWLCRIVYLPNVLLAPILTALVFLGACAGRNYEFDILVSLILGIFAYALVRLGYPVVCLVLGLILGPIVEVNLHRSLSMSFGSYMIFFTRPLTVGIFAITAILMAGSSLLYIGHRSRKTPGGFIEETPESEALSFACRGELILLLVLAGTMAAFLYTGSRYTSAVGLFPNLASILGLGFIFWRLSAILVQALHHRGREGTKASPLPRFSLFQGRLSWQWSIAAMSGYVLAIYLFGFIVASMLYVFGITVMATGYRLWGRALAAGCLVGVGLFFLAKVVHLILPVGLLTNI